MPLPYGGFVVDTPGLKEFGVWEVTRQELEESFPEIASRTTDCRFPDCSHTQEPECAVLAAVAAGDIAEHRFKSYLRILEEAVES